MQATTENLKAFYIRFRDVDFAKETVGLSQAQVRQQAGTAILAQANQSSRRIESVEIKLEKGRKPGVAAGHFIV